MSLLTATVELSGEVLEADASTPEAIIAGLRYVNAMIDGYERLKKQLQKAAMDVVDERGTYEYGGYLLRVSSVQRMQYSKASLRQVFDEDTLDLFLEPAKGKIDRYLKEHLDELGDASTMLRETMEPAGHAYTVVRLERLA